MRYTIFAALALSLAHFVPTADAQILTPEDDCENYGDIVNVGSSYVCEGNGDCANYGIQVNVGSHFECSGQCTNYGVTVNVGTNYCGDDSIAVCLQAYCFPHGPFENAMEPETASAGEEDMDKCFVNDPTSSCDDGACFVNVAASTCRGSCFVNAVVGHCLGSCYVNVGLSVCWDWCYVLVHDVCVPDLIQAPDAANQSETESAGESDSDADGCFVSDPTSPCGESGSCFVNAVLSACAGNCFINVGVSTCIDGCFVNVAIAFCHDPCYVKVHAICATELTIPGGPAQNVTTDGGAQP